MLTLCCAAALAAPLVAQKEPESEGVREARRFERAKEAAARAQAAKEKTAVAQEAKKGESAADAARFERAKDAAAAAEERRARGKQTPQRSARK